MVVPRFYIFGVPDGFDMLEGTRQEISYFLRFYDGSTENTKFTMHRDANGIVTYSFLKYNLSSSKSRTGSFFGMSLAFTGYFCVHPLKLYELFDYVYEKHVLCSNAEVSQGILRPIDNSDIKAQYLMPRFEDCRDLIKFIEKVFLHNLSSNDVLSSSLCPLDPGFRNENLNLMVKLPMEGKLTDESLIGRFREYGYVTISPDWKPKSLDDPTKDNVEIAPQKIGQWKDLIPDYQRYIIQGLGNLADVDKTEVLRYQKQVEGILGQLKKYSYNKNIAPSIQANYEELCNQLADLYSKAMPAVNVSASPDNGGNVTGGGTYEQGALCTVTALANKGYTFVNWIEGGNVVSTEANYTFNVTGNRTLMANFTGGGGVAIWGRIKEWVAENIGKVAAIGGAMIALVVLLMLLRPKNDDGESHDEQEPSYCDLAKDSISEKLKFSYYAEAKAIAENIPDSTCREEELSLVKKEQTDTLNKVIDQLIVDKNWKEAFEKCKEYFDDNVKGVKKAEIQTACLADFNAKIDEVNKNNYSFKSPSIKQGLSVIKSYIGNENYNALIKKLDKKNQPNEESKLETYVVEFYKTDNVYSPESDSPTKTFTSTGNMSTETINVGEDHYIYKIKKDGKYLKGTVLDNAVKNRSHKDICNPKSNEIRLWLQTISEGSFEVGNMKIIVTR